MSEKLLRVDGQQLIRALKRAGFEEHRQRGSHLHMRRTSDNLTLAFPHSKLIQNHSWIN